MPTLLLNARLGIEPIAKSLQPLGINTKQPDLTQRSRAQAGVEALTALVSGVSIDAECPVLQQAPHRTYQGHMANVLDLAWKANFSAHL